MNPNPNPQILNPQIQVHKHQPSNLQNPEPCYPILKAYPPIPNTTPSNPNPKPYIGRMGKGSKYRDAKVPEMPLQVWSYEASPFCKVRPVLWALSPMSLHPTYILHPTSYIPWPTS
jgi:hypothetical protein